MGLKTTYVVMVTGQTTEFHRKFYGPYDKDEADKLADHIKAKGDPLWAEVFPVEPSPSRKETT
jgi:hypothetical protein